MAASAARPTAEAVTLTAVLVTETTVQPGSNAAKHKKAPRARGRVMNLTIQWMRMPGSAPGKGSST